MKRILFIVLMFLSSAAFGQANQYVTPEMFGAKCAGSPGDAAVDTAGFQAAINTGQTVRVGGAGKNCEINATLRFKRIGQIIDGQGYGDPDQVGPSTITWVGANGGTIISFAATAGKLMVQDAQLKNLVIEGGGTDPVPTVAGAGVCVEAYDTSIAGGAWRNRVENVWCNRGQTNVKTPSVGVALGTAGGTDGANDFVWKGGGLYRWDICADGAAATIKFNDNTAFKYCATAGVNARTGSTWMIEGAVFVNNGWDIIATSTNLVSIVGSWFEGSTNGIYQATSAHTLSIVGSSLQTANVTKMMDFQQAAGNVSIKGSFAPTVGGHSRIIANPNLGVGGAYDYDVCTTDIIVSGRGCFSTGVGGMQAWSNAAMTNGQTISVPTGRGSFLVTVMVYKNAAGNIRTSAVWWCQLFDGDAETCTVLKDGSADATHNGSGGAETYSLTPNTNIVVFTYTGGDTVSAFVSVRGFGA